jgi:hypothetical protein
MFENVTELAFTEPATAAPPAGVAVAVVLVPVVTGLVTVTAGEKKIWTLSAPVVALLVLVQANVNDGIASF